MFLYLSMNGSHKSAISEHFRGHSEHGLQKIEKKTSKGRRKQFLPIFPRILVLQLNITRTEKKESSKQQSLI